jgi:hypothetical protein
VISFETAKALKEAGLEWEPKLGDLFNTLECIEAGNTSFCIWDEEIQEAYDTDGQSVFPTAEDCATYDGPESPETGETYVIGWDPARSIDYSGVAIRNSKGQVMKVEQLHEFLSTGAICRLSQWFSKCNWQSKTARTDVAIASLHTTFSSVSRRRRG